MPEFSPGPQFLKEKYVNSENPDGSRGLHNAPEVQRSANFVSNELGDKLNTPDEKIGAYLDRLEGFFNDDDPEKLDRKVGFIKNKLFDLLVTKPENVPASYDKFIINAIEERGQRGVWDNASDEEKDGIRQSNIEGLLADQKESLELWIDYLSSGDAMYPNWLKYWALRSIANLQDFEKAEIDKETGQRITEGRFPQRSNGTLKMFPDLNHEALSYVLDNINNKYQNKPPEIPYDIQEDEITRFTTFLKNENFAKLYAWAIENIKPIDEKLLTTTEGEWVKFPQDSDPLLFVPEGFDRSLVKSVRGKGTGWCTAGVNTAKTQLENGDFYVYYSKDEDGQPTIPRIAIRMEEDNIAEVRGIAKKQNLDPFIGDVLKDKLEEFPDKDKYLKKENDMARLTEIKNKTKADEALEPKDLRFLYELDSKIEGFGYVDDPRIKELRSNRNLEADLLVLFDCTPEQIARTPAQVQENIDNRVDTKAYIGPLFSGIFVKLAHLEHIYNNTFPEGKISRGEVKIGGDTTEQLQKKLEAPIETGNRESKIYESAQYLLNKMYQSKEFQKLASNPITIQTVRLKVSDLGFTENASTDQIYAKAQKLGLELCPTEVGPYQRLKDCDQALYDNYLVAMKQIAGHDGNAFVFSVGHQDLGHEDTEMYFGGASANPDGWWFTSQELMFCLRNVSEES